MLANSIQDKQGSRLQDKVVRLPRSIRRRITPGMRRQHDDKIRKSYTSRTPRPTLRDLAEEHNTSISTVTRAIRELTRGHKYTGERRHRTKLTAADVCEIRRLRDQRLTYPAIARRFGISDSSARLICTGYRWTHVSNVVTSKEQVKEPKDLPQRGATP